ncbi:MAG TPA: helix-turn-helix domain-containing protein [Solirubrobacteraceae bacterium]|nr:helix-turn-helix domain-containing protein [Solirubrobacteraceae bacterium]
MRVNTINDLSAALRGRRLALDLTQAELARRAGVSRQWLNELERGKSTAELGLVLAVIDALGLELEIGEQIERPTQGRSAPDLDALLREHGG